MQLCKANIFHSKCMPFPNRIEKVEDEKKTNKLRCIFIVIEWQPFE